MTLKSDYDAVIVGAGPAGLMAAREIISAGFSVLILEKHEKPGLPLFCAEAVSQLSFDRLVVPKPDWISTRIENIHLRAPGGEELSVHHPNAGYILDRLSFESGLAESVKKSGGELACKTIGISLEKNGSVFNAINVLKSSGMTGKISARIFIAADGVESKIARLAGVDNLLNFNEVESLLQYRLEGITVMSDTIEFYVGNKIAPGGYIWVFPKSDSSANVGLGIYSPDHRGNLCRKLLNDFVEKRFGHPEIKFESCGVVPKYMGDKLFRKDNLLIVGDAARSLDSLSGAGIVNAMLSGKYAGEAAVAYLDGEIPNLNSMDKIYPGRFLRDKEEELILYRKLRSVYVRLTDDDFSEIVLALSEYFSNEKTGGISAGKLLVNIIKTRPRLLRLVRYLL